jgi:hypothetical protein
MNTVPIPGHWSAEQAMLVLDLLEAFHKAIWDTYEQPLVEILRRQSSEEFIIDPMEQAERSGQEAFDFDDDLPF